MIQNKAIELRLYPNKKQEEYFSKCFGCVRLVYNKQLEKRIAYYNENKVSLKTNYAELLDEYPFLSEVEGQALSQATQDLNKAYNNFFKGIKNKQKIGFPKFKSKRNKQSYRTCQPPKNCLDLVNRKLKIPKIGYVKYRGSVNLPDSYKVKNITISKTPTNKYHASLCIEYGYDIPNVELDANKSLGLDYSSHDFYASNFKDSSDYPKFYRLYEDKLAKQQRKLDRMLRTNIKEYKVINGNRYPIYTRPLNDCKNIQKQILKVNKIHEKIANSRKDYLHKLSYKLANEYDYVFVEDLNLKVQAQTLNLAKSVNDNSFGMFRLLLEYKLKDRGKIFHKINKWSISTKMCSSCGIIHKEVFGTTLSENLKTREWTCPDCKTHHSRDVNAAINIRYNGLIELNLIQPQELWG